MATKGRFDTVVDKLYGEMNQRIDRIAVNLRHERAPGQQATPKYEQLAEYMKVRDNPQAWTQIVQQHGIMSAIKYRKSMESLLKRTVDKHMKEFDGMNDIPGFENAPVPAALIPGMEQPAAPAPAPALAAGGMEGEPQQV
jgi:hypothetical protein